jgi:hypothetical protein
MTPAEQFVNIVVSIGGQAVVGGLLLAIVFLLLRMNN